MLNKFDCSGLTVSVIIPATRVCFINAVNSVLDQTLSAFEIFVVDDSKDQSLECTEKNVFLLRTGGSKGVSYSRNLGIQSASGEWIAFLDDDDFWFPSKLQLQLEFALSQSLDATYTKCLLGTIDQIRPRVEYISSLSPLAQIYDFGFRVNSRFYLGFSSLVIKRNAIGETFFDETIRIREDLKFIQEIWNKGFSIGLLNQVLCVIDYSFMRSSNIIKMSNDIAWIRYLFRISKLAAFRFIILNVVRNRLVRFLFLARKFD